VTFRPDFSPPWCGRPHATLVSLNRLPRRQSVALAEAVAGGGALPDAVLQRIVARADGVPLFLEELTKAVLEAAGDTPEPDTNRHGPGGPSTPTIPATLQDSLMARLDRLAGAKEVAQIGAVVGREFGYDLLAAVTPLAEGELHEALQQLVTSELVFIRGTPPTSTYTFKHALVQDAAYASLLRSRRQQLHASIARELEGRWPDVREVRPELLAHHFAEAGLPDKAAIYGLEAGRAAFRRSAVTEAVVHLRRALGLLTRMPEDDDRRRLELDLQIALGHALIAAKGYGVPGVRDAFARARELATAADTALQVSMLSGIGAYHTMRSESRAALWVGRDIVRLSRRGDNPAAYVEGQRRIGAALQQLGRLVPAQRHFDSGLARFAPAQEPVREAAFTVEPYSTLLAHLFTTLLLLGYPDRARARRMESIELARQAAHPLTLAQHLHLAALSAFVLRDRDGLQGWVDEFVALTAEHTLAHFTEWARIWQGWLAAEAGGGPESLPQLQEALSAVRATGARYWSPFYVALLADAHRRVGDADQALEVLGEALEEVKLTDERVYEAELHRLRGAVLLSRAPSPTGEAEPCLWRALAVARGQKARLWELRAATDLARLRQAQGEPREARGLLEPVYAWFTEGFDTPDLKEAAALLDELR
jgi:predicted ATPase